MCVCVDSSFGFLVDWIAEKLEETLLEKDHLCEWVVVTDRQTYVRTLACTHMYSTCTHTHTHSHTHSHTYTHTHTYTYTHTRTHTHTPR